VVSEKEGPNSLDMMAAIKALEGEEATITNIIKMDSPKIFKKV
jgi:hypothetical protein